MTIKCPVNQNLLEYLKKISIESQDEICGYIKKNNGSYDIFQKHDNMHPDSKNYFIIDPKSIKDNEDSILFHSHPAQITNDGFSDWDLENQQYYCLDMLVYGVNSNKFYYKSYG